jgi:hypothetical protein|tara:strand:+ start:1104 stop:1283 length:180 start_codon:yes stop_codon:yes gene_type:complete
LLCQRFAFYLFNIFVYFGDVPQLDGIAVFLGFFVRLVFFVGAIWVLAARSAFFFDRLLN